MKRLMLMGVLLCACGDDDTLPGLDCERGAYRVSGEIDGASVGLSERYRSLTLFNIRESSIDVRSDQGTSVVLHWTGSVPNDREANFDSGEVAGSDPAFADGICATEGTFVLIRDGVRADLTGLKRGDCVTGSPVSGTLKVCTQKD